MKVTKADHARALETLAACFPKGSTVYTIQAAHSRSGMSARYRVLSISTTVEDIDKGNSPRVLWPIWATSKAVGLKLNIGYGDSLTVNGCGFDRADSIREGIERALGYNGGDLKHQAL